MQSNQLLLLMFYFDGQFPWNIPLLLYYPVGVLYKVPFRYDKKWILESLQEKDYFPLKEALIVMKFRELETNNSQQEYIPIRKVTIVKSEIVGDYFYLYMRLGDFILYGEGGLSQFSEKFRRVIGNRDHNILVISANLHEKLQFVSHRDENLEIENWLRLAKLLNSRFSPRMEAYEKNVFLKFHSITVGNNRQLHPIPLTKLLNIPFLSIIDKFVPRARKLLVNLFNGLSSVDNWGYSLYIDKRYTIKIIQFFRPDEKQTYFPEDAYLELDANQDLFFITQKFITIIGHQDIHQFTLETRNNQAIRTSLIIKSREGSSPKYRTELGKKHSLTIPDITIFIRVKHSILSLIRFYILPIMVFLIGSLLVTLATSQLLTLPILNEIVANVQTLRVIELCFGLLFQAIGLYILKTDKQ